MTGAPPAFGPELLQWGPRPDTPQGRRGRLDELISAAPRLIPIIVYAADRRSYLLAEPTGLIGAQPGEARPKSDLAAIPFWREIIDHR